MKEESPSSRSLEASQIPAMKMAEQENGVLGLKRDCFWRRSALRGVVTMVTVKPPRANSLAMAVKGRRSL